MIRTLLATLLFQVGANLLVAQSPARPAEDLLDTPLSTRPAMPATPAEIDALLPFVHAAVERLKSELAASVSEDAKAWYRSVLAEVDRQEDALKLLKGVLVETAGLAARTAAAKRMVAEDLVIRRQASDLDLQKEKLLAATPPTPDAFRDLGADALDQRHKDSGLSLESARREFSEAQRALRLVTEEILRDENLALERPAAIEEKRRALVELEERLRPLDEDVRIGETSGMDPSELWPKREQVFAMKIDAVLRARTVDYLRSHTEDLLPAELLRVNQERILRDLDTQRLDLRVERLKLVDDLLAKEHVRVLDRDFEQTERMLAAAAPHQRPYLEQKLRRHEFVRRRSDETQSRELWTERFSEGGDLTLLRSESDELAQRVNAAGKNEDDSDLPKSTSELARVVDQSRARRLLVSRTLASLDELRSELREKLPEAKRDVEGLDLALSESRERAKELASTAGVASDPLYLGEAQWEALRKDLKEAGRERRDGLMVLTKELSAHRVKIVEIDRMVRSSLRVLETRFVWTREDSRISFGAVQTALGDLEHFPAALTEAVPARVRGWTDWVLDPGNRLRALVLGGVLILLVGAAVMVHLKLPGTFSRLGNNEPGRSSRFLRVAQHLVRRTEIVLLVAVAFLAFCAITRTPPRNTGILAIVFVTPFAWRFLRVLNTVLFAPESNDDRLLRIGDGPARTLHATWSWLINVSLVFVPLGVWLTWIGYGKADANPGFLELWWFLYQMSFYVIVFAGICRPRFALGFIRGQGAVAATVKTLLLLAFPVLAAVLIFLFVLQSLRYEIAVGFFREVFLQAIGSVAVAFVIYRFMLRRLLPARDFHRKVDREDCDSDEQFLAQGKNLTTDLLNRLGLRVLAFVPAIWIVHGLWKEVVTMAIPDRRLESAAFVFLQDFLLGALVAWATVIILRHYRRIMRFVLMPATGLDNGLQYAILTLSSYILVAIGLFICLGALKVQQDQIGWFLAPFAVGIGFGLQDIVKSFVAGIVLLVERPVKVGDQVNVAGLTGVVERINLRSTTLMTFENVGIVVPNEQMVSGVLNNRAAGSQFIRTHFKLGIAYDSDVKMAMRIMLDAMQDHGLVRKKPAPEVFFVGFGNSSIDFECRFWARVTDHRLRVTSDLRHAILNQFTKHGIEIPFPQQDLNIRSVSGDVLRKKGLFLNDEGAGRDGEVERTSATSAFPEKGDDGGSG